MSSESNDKKHWVLGSVVLIVLILGAFLIFHKSAKAPSPTAISTSASLNKDESATPVNNSIVLTKNSSTFGQYFTDQSGKTLYISKSDSANQSNCTGQCLSIWPAYMDISASNNLPTLFSTIKRTDNGKIQYTYKGYPLYYYVGDPHTGDINGNANGNFYIAQP